MNRTQFRSSLMSMAGTALLAAGCSTGFMYSDLPVSRNSVATGTGNTVTFKGAPLKLDGTPIKVGDTIPDAIVAATPPDLKLVSLTDGRGTVRIVSTVPSLDTKVCEQQTHYLSEKNANLDRDVQLITVSVDTPFAQKRFAEEAKIHNVTFLSDYRGGDFGRAYGLLIPGIHVLARAVLVVDKDNVIRYLQVVPELTSMPDMDAAFNAARKTAGLPQPLPPLGSMGGFTY